MTDPSGRRANSSLFEALFVRLLKPDAAFQSELRELGFDVTRMEPSYPLGVWEACLDRAVRREYPNHAPEEGARMLGHRFTEGFFETIIGRLAAVMLPLLSGRRYVERIPSFVHMGVPGLPVTVRWPSPTHATVDVPELAPVAVCLIQGTVEVGFQRIKQRATVSCQMTGPRGGALELQWDA